MNTPNTKKHCRWCKTTKNITDFHKHNKMRDGRLNKCKTCVLEKVAKWRKENPDCRKKEYRRRADKNGVLTKKEWIKKVKENAIGQKASSLKYAHKRRIQTKTTNELTDFVVEEMSSLAEQRKKATGFDWHIDHIIPLNHKKACGLHTWFNLQLVPAWWNLRKNNLNMDEFNYG